MRVRFYRRRNYKYRYRYRPYYKRRVFRPFRIQHWFKKTALYFVKRYIRRGLIFRLLNHSKYKLFRKYLNLKRRLTVKLYYRLKKARIVYRKKRIRFIKRHLTHRYFRITRKFLLFRGRKIRKLFFSRHHARFLRATGRLLVFCIRRLRRFVLSTNFLKNIPLVPRYSFKHKRFRKGFIYKKYFFYHWRTRLERKKFQRKLTKFALFSLIISKLKNKLQLYDRRPFFILKKSRLTNYRRIKRLRNTNRIVNDYRNLVSLGYFRGRSLIHFFLLKNNPIQFFNIFQFAFSFIKYRFLFRLLDFKIPSYYFALFIKPFRVSHPVRPNFYNFFFFRSNRKRLRRKLFKHYFVLTSRKRKFNFRRVFKRIFVKFKNRNKRFNIRGYLHFRYKIVLYLIYIRRKTYFRRLRIIKKRFRRSTLRSNTVRNNFFYLFNRMGKKNLKLFIFIGSVINCFFNTTFKQYNYVLNLAFKNLVYLPFFSVFHLLRAQITRLLVHNKLIIDLFFQAFQFSRVWFHYLKRLRRRRRNGYRIRKRILFYSKRVYSSKRLRTYKFLKNFKHRRSRFLKFKSLKGLSNKFILRNTVKVYRFFLKSVKWSHMVFAWRNFSDNFVWTNRNVSLFFRLNKLRGLIFLNKMNYFDTRFGLLSFSRLFFDRLFALSYFWRYFIMRKRKFKKLSYLLFVYIRFILKLSVLLICRNLIN